MSDFMLHHPEHKDLTSNEIGEVTLSNHRFFLKFFVKKKLELVLEVLLQSKNWTTQVRTSKWGSSKNLGAKLSSFALHLLVLTTHLSCCFPKFTCFHVFLLNSPMFFFALKVLTPFDLHGQVKL
jgi:hypothetical protein